MSRIVIVMMFINLVSKFLGMFRDISQSYYLGATFITDAYIVSLSIPGIILGIVGQGILSSYIPMYNHIKEKHGIQDANVFTVNLINFGIIFSIIISIVGIVYTPFIVKIFSYGFDTKTFNLAVFYTRIMMGSTIFLSTISICGGFLQLNNKFYIVAFQGVPLNVIYILGNYIAYKYGYKWLSLMANLALISQFIIFLPTLKNLKLPYKFYFNWKDIYLKEIVIMSIPVIVGTSIEQLNMLVDRTVVSRLGEGAISLLNYSGRLNSAIYSLTISVILSVLFPKISSLVSENRIQELKIKINYVINIIIIFLIPCVVIIIFLSRDIVSSIFGHGHFTPENIAITSKTLIFYSMALIPLCIRDLFTKILYCYKNTKIPVINSLIGIVFNIILSIILSKYFGIPGVAIATTISNIIIVILLGKSLTQNYENFITRKNIVVFVKVVISSIILGTILIYINEKLVLRNYSKILISVSFAGICYYFLMLLFRVEETILGTKFLIRSVNKKMFK